MALAAGIPPRTLQQLLSTRTWDQEQLRRALLERVCGCRDAVPTLGFAFELAHRKKGDKTPGVHRQFSPATERSDSYVVSLHLGFSGGGVRNVLESELYLPEAWAKDPGRCRQAGIPDGTAYRTRWEIGLDLLERVNHGRRPFQWFMFDEAMGCKPDFIARVACRQILFLGEVPAPGVNRSVRGVHPFRSLSLFTLSRAHGSRLRTFLSNAPEGFPLEEIALLVSRWDRERANIVADLQSIGVSHFELRNYRALQRHFLLSACTLWLRHRLGGRALEEFRSEEAGAIPQEGSQSFASSCP
jgi:SRSO17 transposase